jgi:hypothetical protein
MPVVVPFPMRPATVTDARTELRTLVDALTVLALTRPAAVLAIKEIVVGLMRSESP